jgi:hypothetical protein
MRYIYYLKKIFVLWIFFEFNFEKYFFIVYNIKDLINFILIRAIALVDIQEEDRF